MNRPADHGWPRPTGETFRVAGVLAVVWVALGVFGVVVGTILVGRDGTGPVQSFDRTVHDWFIAHRTGLVGISRFFATVFDAPLLGLIVVAATIVAVVRATRSGALRWSLFGPFVAYLGAEAAVFFVRLVIHRPRPASADFPGVDALRGIHETSWSFPSGHATGPVAVFLAVAGVVAARHGRRWPFVAALGLGILVALSRLVLGVHWFFDVAVGLVIGTIWGVAVCRAQRRVDETAGGPGHLGSPG